MRIRVRLFAVQRELAGTREVALDVPPAATVAAVADAMIGLLTDAPARGLILLRADAVLSRYDWALPAGDTLTVLEEAALGR